MTNDPPHSDVLATLGHMEETEAATEALTTVPNVLRTGPRRPRSPAVASDTMLRNFDTIKRTKGGSTMPDTAIGAQMIGSGRRARQKQPQRRYVSRLTRSTLAVVMAGGRGERLKHLTDHRCKPATPFGGKFRIIDFVLSNCVNSGVRRILILTQYKAHSLIQHIQRGWNYSRGEFGEFIEIIPAQQQLGDMWYRGTADSLYQNLQIIKLHHPRHILVLAGDHIYKMDYGPMLASHLEKKADITVGVVEVPREHASGFGVMTVDENYHITRFAEKPRDRRGYRGGSTWRWVRWEFTYSRRACCTDCSKSRPVGRARHTISAVISSPTRSAS